MIANKREIVYEMLNDVLTLNKTIESKIEKSKKIDSEIKKYVTAILYGVVENKIYFDYIINLIKIDHQPNIKVKIILYMFMYETFIGNKNKAKIANVYVDLAKSVYYKAHKFINFILRKLSSIKIEDFQFENELEEFRIKNSICYDLFYFLIKKFEINYVKKIFNYLNKNYYNYIRINNLKISTNEFIKKYKNNLEIIQDDEIEYCFKYKNKISLFDLFDQNLLKNGIIYIQNKNSITACLSLNPHKGSKIWDMCAAPGGKLISICNIVENDANIYATEINKHKQNKLNQNILNYKCNIKELKYIDALNYCEDSFDYIMLDAPCSASGTIYKNPDIKNKSFSDKDLIKLTNLQLKLLEKAYSCLNQKGTLVYSTCSIFKEENKDLIKKFLINKNDLTLVNEKIFEINEENIEGFYFAKIIKN